MNLRARLAILFVGIVVIATGSTFLFVRLGTEGAVRSYVFAGDAEKAKVYAKLIGDYYGEKKHWDGIQTFLAQIPGLVFELLDTKIHGDRKTFPAASYPFATIGSLLSDRIVVADEGGIIVADTSNLLIGTLHPPQHLSHGAPIMVSFEHRGTVLVNSMVDSSLTGANETFLRSLYASLVGAVVISTFLALIIALPLALRALHPLGALTSAVERVSHGDLSVTVPVSGRDELAVLGRSFNSMTAELRRLEEAKRRIIADSAHELRTPVTLIRGSIEAMLDGIYPLDLATIKNIHEETMRLSKLIDMLHELELIDSGEMRLDRDELDLLAIAERAVQLFAPVAGEKRVTLSLRSGGSLPAPILGDTLRINEVLYNLINNAIKFTPADGRVDIRVEAEPGSMKVKLIVEDSGPGIPENERERVFERFYRIDKSRSGLSGGRGLGLAIVQEIVKAHEGSVRVGQSPLGGASFHISFPRA